MCHAHVSASDLVLLASAEAVEAMARLQMTTMVVEATIAEDHHVATAHAATTIVAALLHRAITTVVTHAMTAMVLHAAVAHLSMTTHHVEAAIQMTATAHHRPDEVTSRSLTPMDMVVSHMPVVHEALLREKVAEATVAVAAVVPASHTERGLTERPLDRCGAQHTTPAPT